MAVMGRPSIYSDELAANICERLVMGESLKRICTDDDMPNISTIFKWLNEKPDFSDSYAKAKEEQAEALADEIVAISDEVELERIEVDGVLMAVKVDSTAVARNRLRVDARKWVAAKLKPKKYGDRLDSTVTQVTMTHEEWLASLK